MNKNCINLKQKLNKKNLECKKFHKNITFQDCKNCIFKEYNVQNNYKNNNISKKKYTIKKKTSKLNKLERNRSSLFTKDLNHCIICGRSQVNKHEIFGGRNRLNSIKYKLVIPLCTCLHHNQINCKGIHFDKKLEEEWHKKGQAIFEETYPELSFIEIFHKNYLK